MPKLPVVSGKEATKVFEKLGYVYRHTTGDHMIYRKPGARALSIPDHGELDAGLLRKLISDAGTTPAEFQKLLR